MTRRIVGSLLAMTAVIAAAIVSSGDGEQYAVRMNLTNAGGLKEGSPVVIGGAQVGTVALHLGTGDRVQAELKIDAEHAPLGRGTKAAISAVNLLGQKRVQLSDTTTSAGAAPSGYALPARQVLTSTDLDQVLSVLDAGTRSRLAILLNEAGAAVTGRREDFSELLGAMPVALDDARRLLTNVVTDNHTLGMVLDRSDRLVAELAGRRREVAALIGTVGETAATVSSQRAHLRATLARAPRTVMTLRSFLVALRKATRPLGPAARDLSAAAPELSRTLDQLKPFTQAARPALEQAVAVAPKLSRLARGATPVLRRAVPTTSALAQLATSAKPVGLTLDHSADNILAVVDNWSKAVQFRDGLSHVFRGEASVSPDLLQSVIDRLTAKKPTAKRTPSRQSPVPILPARPAGEKPKDGVPKRPAVLPDLPKTVDQILGSITGLLPGGARGQGDAKSGTDQKINGLLDFLLGS